MNIEIYVNDIIEWLDQSENKLIERVLWIDEDYTLAFVFDINSQKGFPEPRKISEIKAAISDGSAYKTISDPWARIVREEELSNKNKEIRNNAWEVISSLVIQEPSIYYRHLRGSLIKEFIEKFNQGKSQDKLREKRVYNYLRKFWQRGKTKNALLPDYTNSGGKGKVKQYRENAKRGRPRKYAHDPEIGKGINITETDRKFFRLGIAEFYNNSKKNTLVTAYNLTINKYYTEDTYHDENGVKKSILIPPNERPTFRQFQYWYQLEQKDIRKTLVSRKGSRKFNLENRAITGSSKAETIGPGSRYQIDATVADVYLVSLYNRNWIIGRPIIYVVIDVFSRMITGVYIGLEGPSWIGAMMALANAAADKVEFCKEYGIEITENEWSCHHVPDTILGDRGELAGMAVETLIPNLHIRIENAASYRADWKGLVERHFRIIHEQVKPFLPGYVDIDFKQRGGKDYRLDSTLDIHQFTKIVIRLILHHNNHHYLANYERDEAMIVDEVAPVPRELWNWGIANRSGRLRTYPEDIVKLNLMPTAKATITARGIKFKGMYYTCDKALKEQWFEKARSNYLSKSEKRLTISFDVRKPNFIYIPSEDGRNFEKCYLNDAENRFIDKNLYDIEYLLAEEQRQKQKNEGKELQEKVDLYSEIENIANEAKKMKEAVEDENVSNRKKVAGIRDNRSAEKAKRRKNEGFELDKDKDSNKKEYASTSNTQNIDSKKPEQPQSLKPNRINLLRQKQQKRKNEPNK